MKIEYFDINLLSPTLENDEVFSTFMHFNPNGKNSVKESYKEVLKTYKFNREWLSEILLTYNNEIGGDKEVQINCANLKKPNATIVATGQQAGIFTGPIYTIYKIITTINLAIYYQQHFHSPVIPLFWNATEDHDLSEISSFFYPEKKWQMPFPRGGVAAEALTMGTECKNFVLDYLATIPESNFKEDIRNLVTNGLENYGCYSSRIISSLFKGSGLVVMEPRLLRESSRGFFQKCILERNAINEGLEIAATRLKSIRTKSSFEIRQGRTGLFYINEKGTRRRIEEKKGKFNIDGNKFSEPEVLELINRNPGKFSTAAFLRPVLQSLRLPTLIYVAGPSEFKYHLQLLPIFRIFDAVMPVIKTRNHATILTRNEQKLASLLQLKTRDFFTYKKRPYQLEDLPGHYKKAFTSAKSDLNQFCSNLYNSISELSSPQKMDTFKKKMHFQLEKLEVKTVREFYRSKSIDYSRKDRFYNCILPKNGFQERGLNVLYFVEKNGLQLVKDLMDVMDPFEKRHYIIFTDR